MAPADQGQDMQSQVIALVQAAMQGDQQAQQTIQQIMQAAEQGDQQAMQIAQLIQQVMEQMQGQAAQSQRIGGKLAYIHRLRTGVGMDEDVVYERCGGKVTKKVVKKAEKGCDMDDHKAAMKNKKLAVIYFDDKGNKIKGAKKCYFGGTL